MDGTVEGMVSTGAAVVNWRWSEFLFEKYESHAYLAVNDITRVFSGSSEPNYIERRHAMHVLKT